jgi:hypothetical protein
MQNISTRRKEMHRKGTAMEDNNNMQTKGDLINHHREIT